MLSSVSFGVFFNACLVIVRQLILAMCMLWAVGMLIESQTGLDWKRPQSSSSSNFPAVGRDTFHKMRLIRAQSNLSLNTYRHRPFTISLSILFQYFTTLTINYFFIMFNLNLLCFSLKPYPLLLSLHALANMLCWGIVKLSGRYRGSFKPMVFLKVCSIPLTEAEIKLKIVLL